MNNISEELRQLLIDSNQALQNACNSIKCKSSGYPPEMYVDHMARYIAKIAESYVELVNLGHAEASMVMLRTIYESRIKMSVVDGDGPMLLSIILSENHDDHKMVKAIRKLQKKPDSEVDIKAHQEANDRDYEVIKKEIRKKVPNASDGKITPLVNLAEKLIDEDKIHYGAMMYNVGYRLCCRFSHGNYSVAGAALYKDLSYNDFVITAIPSIITAIDALTCNNSDQYGVDDLEHRLRNLCDRLGAN